MNRGTWATVGIVYLIGSDGSSFHESDIVYWMYTKQQQILEIGLV
jgi:hypothetical protein